jgi:hypothetical protein
VIDARKAGQPTLRRAISAPTVDVIFGSRRFLPA